VEYKCQLFSIKQLLIGPNGFVEPLCDKCLTADCTNPIEKKKISVMGVIKEMKIYSRSSEEHFVVNCTGFSRE
jgi:hypothetical protein